MTTTMYLPARDTLRAFRALSGVRSRDDARPLLSAMQVECKGEEVSVVATDSYRLAHTTFPSHPKGKGDVSGLVPASLVDLICKVFTRKEVLSIGREEFLRLVWEGDRVSLDWGGQVLSGPVVKGTYPDWRQLVPDDTPKHEPVAWDVEYLAELTTIRNEFWGAGQSIPVRLIVAQTVKPTLFRMSVQGDGQVDYLLMPVRTS